MASVLDWINYIYKNQPNENFSEFNNLKNKSKKMFGELDLKMN